MRFCQHECGVPPAVWFAFLETQAGRRFRIIVPAVVSKVVPGEVPAKCALRFIIRLFQRLF
jgi:hypothetical protein